jgi:O-antigen/teichoic acid export membrane protein
MFNILQIAQRACFALPALIALNAGLNMPWICLIFAVSPLPTTLWFLKENQSLRKILRPEHWTSGRAWQATMATLHSESKFLFVDLLATLTASIPTLIIAKTSTLTQLGGYSLAERFKSYVITVFSPMNSSQYQRLCRYYLQGLYDKASILLSRYQLAVWLLALSIASLASTMIPSQLNTFGAGQYDDANQAFVIFLLFIPFLTVSAGFNLLYFSSQRLTMPQQLSAVSKGVLFALIYWPVHGPLGSITAAATAAVASELLATLLAFLSSRHRSRLSLRLW